MTSRVKIKYKHLDKDCPKCAEALYRYSDGTDRCRRCGIVTIDDLVSKDGEFYTTEELANIFGVHQMTVYSWIKKGKIKSQKVQGKIVIPNQELQQPFLLERRSKYRKRK